MEEEAVFLLQDSSVVGRVKELLALVYTGQTTVETSETVFLLLDSDVGVEVKELLVLMYTGQTTVETSEDLEGLGAPCKSLSVKIPLKVTCSLVLFRSKLFPTATSSVGGLGHRGLDRRSHVRQVEEEESRL